MSQIKDYPQVTAVMCTYGRFTCVERAMNCFLAQTYPNKRLIIYNTDINSRYEIQDWFSEKRILVWNNNVDYLTRENYTNVGAIRRDALDLVSDGLGGYVVTWDDDDIFLPWFMEQAVDRITETGLPSFKPEMSFFYSSDNLRLVMNTLEASVVAKYEKIVEYGYLLETGKEGLGWYTKMRDNRELDEHDKNYLPSYCFNWNDGYEMNAPHKQSGDIDNPDNFNNHKEASRDAVNGRELSIYTEEKMRETYKPYFDFIREHEADFPSHLVEKYFTPHLLPVL
jgi:glycosyltransferase involved in cell wall biosynthesis